MQDSLAYLTGAFDCQLLLASLTYFPDFFTVCDADCSAISKLEVAGQVLDDMVGNGGRQQFDLLSSNVGSFRGNVVYVDLAEDDGKAYLSELAGDVQQRLHARGVVVTNLDQSFTSHITVAKTSKLRSKQKQKLRFTPEAMAHLQSTSSDATEASSGPVMLQITSLQLCRMAGRNPGSYYHIEKESMLQQGTRASDDGQ